MRALRALVSSVFMTVMFGCGAAGAGTHSNGPSVWDALSETATCEAMNPAYCLGGYGFFIDSTGQYIAGGDHGPTEVRGKLTQEEFAALDAAATALAPTVFGPPLGPGTESCAPTVPIPGISDRITMGVLVTPATNTYASVDVYRADATGICHTGDATKAAAVRDLVHQLRAKYYPIPFPSH